MKKLFIQVVPENRFLPTGDCNLALLDEIIAPFAVWNERVILISLPNLKS